MGWLAAVTLMMLSAPAWALDLDHAIAEQEADAAQILSTLGRDKAVNAETSKETDEQVHVQLVRVSDASKRR